jgi:hypothetical protein
VKTSHTLLAFCVAFSLFCSTLVAQSEGSDYGGTLVQIDDQTITDKDINRQAERTIFLRPDLDPSAVTTIALGDLIRQAIFSRAVIQLQLPVEQFNGIIESHTNKEIGRYGSHQQFLDAKKAELGVNSFDEYREYLYHDFVKSEVINIVLGRSPSPNKGFRMILEPSPAKIRCAYKENEKYRLMPAVMNWSFIKFAPSASNPTSPTTRAAEAASAFESKEIDFAQLLALADSEITREGYSADSAAWVVSFLSNAKSGDVLVRPASASGTVSILVTTEIEAARELNFSDAQSIIRQTLMTEAQAIALDKFYKSTADSVDVWVSEDIPGLKAFVEQMIGRDISSNNSAKL